MAHPYVSAVTFRSDKIVITVKLDGFLAGQSVEVSGYATQNSGAFATFRDVQTVKANPDGSVIMYVLATAGNDFVTGEPVTVSMRSAAVKEWVTVLTEEGGHQPQKQGPKAPDGTSWDSVSEVGWSSGGKLSRWTADQAAADGANFREP